MSHLIAQSRILIVVSVLCLVNACLGLQNIRIQVNNENLQQPPYLLEAIKQAAALDTKSTSSVSTTGSRFAEPSDSLSLGRSPSVSSNNPQQANNQPVPVESDAIERLLDLSPESVLRLSPETLIQDADQVQSGGPSVEPAESRLAVASSAQLARETAHRTQLPVTNSHLKRPSLGPDQLEQASFRPTVGANGAGGKSRVSPSVQVDEAPAAVNLYKKPGPTPPDTWEPSQVMAGASNSSLVPATVRRQYGHQTRTRITLGGGYTRDKPEKPVDQPERTQPPETSKGESVSGSVESIEYEGLSGAGSLENSRLVEVPNRIVLPASVFNQRPSGASQLVEDLESSSDSSANVKVIVSTPMMMNTSSQPATTKRRDPRCPASGTQALEHPTACDKYFLCQGGELTEQTCPNGLMYGPANHVRDYCVHRWEAVCGDKSIPNPISSPGCRWQNGIFSVQGSPKCVPDFYECKDGLFEVRKCTIGGQVYDDRTKTCRFAEQVGCAEEALADFKCPPDDQTNTYWPFPRYFLNERALIHCISDKPQIIRCRDHERVDPEHLFCVNISKSSAPSGSGEEGSQPEMTERRLVPSVAKREKCTSDACKSDG